MDSNINDGQINDIPQALPSIDENFAVRQVYLNALNSPSSSSFSTISSAAYPVSSSVSRPSSPKNDSIAVQEVDRFGFLERLSESENKMYLSSKKNSRKEAARSMKWIKMIRKHGESLERLRASHKFIRRLFKGIPDCLRAKMWQLFVDDSLNVEKLNFSVSFYLFEGTESGYERQIDLDIERTLRDHIYFQSRFGSGQLSLFKILVAYANHNPDVGYCQGMSTIVAFLLMYFDEEMAFHMFVQILAKYNLCALFQTGFKRLFEVFQIQEDLIKEMIPQIYRKFESLQINTSIYCPKWYLTLYLSVPYHTSLRIWDLFLFFGFDILPVIGVSLLKYFEDEILKSDFEKLCPLLNKFDEKFIDDDKLINDVINSINKP